MSNTTPTLAAPVLNMRDRFIRYVEGDGTETAGNTAGTGTEGAAAAQTAATTATSQTATETAGTTQTSTQTQANPWDDPAAARAEIEKLRRENASARVTAKQTAADEARAQLTQEFGKILGLVKDDNPVTPEHLTEQLTSAQTAAKAAALELAIYKTAATAKADPAALLDSRAFLDKVAGIDPTDNAALAAAISEATTSNPRFKVTQAAPVGGADFTGGSGPARTYTRAQIADQAFYTANRSDILAALQTGRITN